MIDADMMQDRIRDANPIPTLDALDADELAYFLATTRTRRAAAMQAPTQHPTEAAPPPAAPPPRRRRVWAFAAAFVLILVVIGATALILGGDDARVSDEPAPPTNPAVTPTTAAVSLTEPILAETLVWSRVPYDEAVFGVPLDQDTARADSGFGIVSVTPGGPGLVAVGHSICPGTTACRHNAAVWTSPDGINWARLPNSGQVFGGPGLREMEAVAAGGPGLVAVGVALDEPQRDGLYATVWTSEDGIVWSRVPFDKKVFGAQDPDERGFGRTWMHSVTGGGPGLVAVGEDSWRAAVWTSPDGITWTRVPHDKKVFGRGKSNRLSSGISEVISGGPGLVAIGELNGKGAVWTSPDGITWSVWPHGLDINGVAVGGPGFVAVGTHETTGVGCHPGEAGDCHAVVWTSPDAVTWTQVPYDEAVFGSPDDKQDMNAVTAVGSGFVAVGSSVWVSPDGINWSRVGVSTRGSMDSVVVGGPGLVALGERDNLPAIWTATPER